VVADCHFSKLSFVFLRVGLVSQDLNFISNNQMREGG
jgi:hypothetical protein